MCMPQFHLTASQLCRPLVPYLPLPPCSHLSGHPQVLSPSTKEPEFFTRNCGYNAMRCITSQQRMYMRDVSGLGGQSVLVKE